MKTLKTFINILWIAASMVTLIVACGVIIVMIPFSMKYGISDASVLAFVFAVMIVLKDLIEFTSEGDITVYVPFKDGRIW